MKKIGNILPVLGDIACSYFDDLYFSMNPVGEIPIFPIFLENVRLKSTYRMYLTGLHSIFRHEYDNEEDFINECVRGIEEDFKIERRPSTPPKFGCIKVSVVDDESGDAIAA